jgi:hypothetical protein
MNSKIVVDMFVPMYFVQELHPVQGIVNFWFTVAKEAQDEIRKASQAGVLHQFGVRKVLKHKYLTAR